MQQTSYPTTRYQLPDIPDYSSSAERRRLSSPALRQFFEIMRKWNVETKDARLMLGGITNQRYKLLSMRSEGRTLNQDQLLRTTNVTAIDQSLHKRLSMRKADEWALTPNKQFYGGTSLYNLIAGGPIALWEWRLSLEKQLSEQMKAKRSKAKDTTTIE